MTPKRLLPLLRGLFGLSDPKPETKTAVALLVEASGQHEPEVAKPVAEPRLTKAYLAKKVLYQTKKGGRLTARIIGMSDNGEIILRRAHHPLARTFVRPTSVVFLR